MGQQATLIAAPITTVEILTYVGNPVTAYSEGSFEPLIPHTFLRVTDANGHTQDVGFAPQQTGLVGNGEIFNNNNHPFLNSSGPITLSVDQGALLQQYINGSITSPPYYNLPGGSMCTVWALNGVLYAKTGTTIDPTFGSTPQNPMGPLGTLIAELVNPYTTAMFNEGFQLGQFFVSTAEGVSNLFSSSSTGTQSDLGITTYSNGVQYWEAPNSTYDRGWIIPTAGGREEISIATVTGAQRQVYFDLNGNQIKQEYASPLQPDGSVHTLTYNIDALTGNQVFLSETVVITDPATGITTSQVFDANNTLVSTTRSAYSDITGLTTSQTTNEDGSIETVVTDSGGKIISDVTRAC